MRIFLLSVLCLLALPLLAQRSIVSGKVVDESNNVLPGANVSLSQEQRPDLNVVTTDADGTFRLERVTAGNYTFRVTFLGYETFEQPINVGNRPLDLGLITLREKPVQLGTVEVKGEVVPAMQKGDTTELNADAFKTLPDANAQDLIEKMPTVTVENGRVQAQGEDVKQVLVDGRPFFGNDPTAALRNLPAEVIDKIQIFDQQSDQAQFTGINDGETSKTINIITRSNMRAGQFGKIYAGYGLDDRFRGGGNINAFSGDRRISIIGMSNNINEQNFSSEDLLGVLGSGGRGGSRGGGFRGGGGRGGRGGSANDFMVNQQGGIATTHALGINYSDKWGKKMEVTGSYFFNFNNNNADQLLNQELIDDRDISQVYAENTGSRSKNYNHRLNFTFEYTIDSLNSIIMRPRFSLQKNDGNSSTFGQTTFGTSLLNEADNLFSSNLSGVDFNNNLLFRHRFAKDRRTLSVNLSTGYNNKNGDNLLQSTNSFFTGPALSDTLDQSAMLDNRSWNLSTNLQYTEPLGKNSSLSANYRLSWQQEDSDKETFDFAEITQQYDLINPLLSNVFSNDYITHQAGGAYNYNKGRDMYFMVRANLQWANLVNDQTFPQETQFRQTFVNVLPFVMLRYNFSRQTNMNVFYRTNTQLPSITQLQNVVDNSNPLQLKVGNPNLAQAFQHSLFIRYSSTNTEKSSVFFALIGGGFTRNYIANGTYLADSDHPIFADLNVARGAQLTQPVNLDGYWNMRSFVTYGLPLSFIKTNLNLNLSGNYSRIPGLINDALNYSGNLNLGLGVVLASNISEKVDFTISSRSNVNQVNNTLRPELDTRFFNQNSSVRLNWIFAKGFVFRTDLTNQLYTGLSEGFNQNYWLWNLGLGKKLFRNDRGELTLSVFDLLKQNTSITRNVTEIYIEDVQTNVLQQYFMLTFTYNLRNFGTPPSSGWGDGPPRDGRPPFMRDF